MKSMQTQGACANSYFSRVALVNELVDLGDS